MIDNTAKELRDKRIANLRPFKKGEEWKGNAKGRPIGSVSIKDGIRQYLEDNPDKLKEVVQYFIDQNRELMWTMLEGSPKQTTENKNTSIEIEITGADLLLAQQLREQRINKPIGEGGGQ